MKFTDASSSKQAFPKAFQFEASRSVKEAPSSKEIDDMLAPPHAKRKVQQLVSQLYTNESLAPDAEDVRRSVTLVLLIVLDSVAMCR